MMALERLRCDAIAGELLVSFHSEDPAGHDLIEMIRGGRLDDVELAGTLPERLGHVDLSVREDLRLFVARLRVPAGDEYFKINYLQFFYKHALLRAASSRGFQRALVNFPEILARSDFHFQVVPNSVLSIAQGGFSCTLSPTHAIYKQLLGIPPTPAAGAKPTVLVLDTGYDPSQQPLNVILERNFVDPLHPVTAPDDHGHGSAVAAIIQEVCPHAALVVFKVADAKGRASEWDLLAALAAQSGAHVVNISLAFGLAGRHCSVCGRESHESRSAVFESMLRQLISTSSPPIVVAAAGNAGKNELSFPARFEDVVAVESVDSGLHLSDFSNFGTTAEGSQPHQNVFILPGGQKFGKAKATEFVGTGPTGTEYWGTSFAAAYASGLISALWSSTAHSHYTRTELLDHLRNSADTSFPGYTPATHGNGFMRF